MKWMLEIKLQIKVKLEKVDGSIEITTEKLELKTETILLLEEKSFLTKYRGLHPTATTKPLLNFLVRRNYT